MARAGWRSSISMRHYGSWTWPWPPLKSVEQLQSSPSGWAYYLSVSSKSHCSVSKTIATQRSTHILDKIHATADKGKKKRQHSRIEVPLAFEATVLKKYIASLWKILLIGKLLPTFCHSIKLVHCDCSHWNCKNFHCLKGMYKSLHDLSHRYETLQPGKYKQ